MGTSTLVEIGDMPVIVHCSLFLVHWDPFLKNVGGSNKITSTCWETFEVKLWVLKFETHNTHLSLEQRSEQRWFVTVFISVKSLFRPFPTRTLFIQEDGQRT